MAWVMNGITIPEASGNVIANGIAVQNVVVNGILAWATTRSAVFTANGTFTVPENVSSINYCIVGGGGSGSSVEYSYATAGGFSGAVGSGTISVTPGQTFAVSVGGGGPSVISTDNGVAVGATDGAAGGATSFGSYVAIGGAGGISGTTSYNGNRAARTTCGGTGYDGAIIGWSFGGQSSGFGNGGAGGYYIAAAGNGGVGSGGGAHSGSAGNSGAGGRGEVRISW